SSPSLVSPRPWMPSLSPYTTLFRSGRSKSQGLEALLELHHVDPGQGRRVQGERPLRPAARSRIRLGRDGLGPDGRAAEKGQQDRSEEHTSELQSRENLVCRLLLGKR